MRLTDHDAVAAPLRAVSTDSALIPLINIVFLMLIFFMLAGSIKAPDALPVEPPLSRQGESLESEAITLLLGRDGRIALDGDMVSPDEIQARLAPLLRQRQPNQTSKAAAPGPTLRVKADAAVDVGRLRELLGRLRELGIARVELTARQRQD